MFGMVFKSLSFFKGICSDRYGGSTYAAVQKSKAFNCSNSNNNDDDNACFLEAGGSVLARSWTPFLDRTSASRCGGATLGPLIVFFLPLLTLKVVYMDALRIDKGWETGQHGTS